MAGKYILVGAKPSEKPAPNPGGQLTASLGLIEYAKSLGYEISVIDTTQSSFPIPPLKARVFRGFSRVRQLWKKLSRRDVSGVIIFSSSGFSFYERILLSAICRVYQVPDIFFVRSGHFYNEVKSSIIKRIAAMVLLKIPHIIGAQGQDWVEFYKGLGVREDRTVVVRNWLGKNIPECSDLVICNSNSLVKFVFVGWLVKEKGVDKLLAAAHALSKNNKFILQIIGGGTLESYCRDFVESNGLHDYIEINGWQDNDFIVKALKSSHVFILPSEAEGFPNALLEAMALGLPSICTQVGGVSDSLKNEVNGYLLKDNSISSIIIAMRNYIEEPWLIEEHSGNTLKIYNKLHNRKQNCQILFSQFKV